jgi:death-on-curing protein
MDTPFFLTIDHALAIHRRVIAEFGGDSSIRDAGLLESAVMLPAAQFSGRFLHDGIPAMAAAYLFHVCRNHPFLDGNKRTALAAAEVFLLLNAHTLDATNYDLESLTVGVAAGIRSKEEVTAFFRQHAAPGADPR